MMLPNETRDLKKKSKRLVWFILGICLFDAFIAFLFFRYVPGISQVLVGFIIICITGLLYLPFTLICAKIDKKKAEKIKNAGKKDPFSHN